MSEAFKHAVTTARANIPIQRETRKPEYLTGYTIVQHNDGNYAVYTDDAWTEPTEQPLLPWSPPTGTPVARVDLEGKVHI